MMNNLILQFLIYPVVLLIIFPESLFAERVKPLNPDCDVCPVVICYEGEEAKRILGKEAVNLLLKLTNLEQKTNKIDLDGVKNTGSETDSDEGYELLVFSYNHLISINSIFDKAVIQIKTDPRSLSPEGISTAWSPEIHLRPPGFVVIDKTDDLETAWHKVKEGSLYQYINKDGAPHHMFKDNLGKMILYVLKTVTE
ncbi:MAG: hypothetical protein RBT11_04735 [Desulfobacterales bacterium]|jgi:hypothetical protein|nr:hypothetical protein [Desulfobacterales bacterium]